MFTNTSHIYDAIYSRLDYGALAAVVTDSALKHVPEAKSLLDVGCGTGLLLAELKEKFSVQGVDLDSGMLDVARARLTGVPLHEGNMIDLDLGETFDVVVCLFSSIGYTAELELMRQAVARMAAHLSRPGVLMIDPWIMPEMWRDDHLHADFVDEPTIKIARFGNNRREGRKTMLEMHHLVSTAEGVSYLVDNHTLFMFTDTEYRDAFARAGLEVEFLEGGLVGRGMYVGWR